MTGVPETRIMDWLVNPTPVAVIEIGGAVFDSTGEISVSCRRRKAAERNIPRAAAMSDRGEHPRGAA